MTWLEGHCMNLMAKKTQEWRSFAMKHFWNIAAGLHFYRIEIRF
jgi:hypothetical protein